MRWLSWLRRPTCHCLREKKGGREREREKSKNTFVFLREILKRGVSKWVKGLRNCEKESNESHGREKPQNMAQDKQWEMLNSGKWPINARNSDVWNFFKVFCVLCWSYCYCVPFTPSSLTTPSLTQNSKSKSATGNSFVKIVLSGAWKRRGRVPRWSSVRKGQLCSHREGC